MRKIGGFTVFAVFVLFAPLTLAAETSLFRIGTGGIGGTYYPIGQSIAAAISNPKSKSDCASDPCGVPGLLAIGETSNGSVANIASMKSGYLESGFTQSDIAHWARTGTGIYEGEPAFPKVLGIASLFKESIHLVVHKDAGIKRVHDLVGKRVSLDDPGSGTLVDARILLNAYGISEADMMVQYIKPAEAMKKMRKGELDAFFFIAGYPSKAITELSNEKIISLIDIAGTPASRIISENSFFSHQIIPAGSYPGLGEVRTLGLAALWVVQEDVSEELVYNITKSFWKNLPAQLTASSHPKLAEITLDKAYSSLCIPLHPGARKFYEDAGLIPREQHSN